MKEKKTSEVKSNVVSGMSSAAGAAVGVVAGSAISSEVNAAEIPVTPVEEQEVEIVSSQPAQSNNHINQDPTPAPVVPEPEPVKPEPIDPVLPPKPEVEVISYHTETTENGNQIDVAVVNDNGQIAMFVDVDRDGIADYKLLDSNHNGELDDNEIIDVTEQNIAMQPFQDAVNAGTGNFYAQTDDVDYINNANVDEYMA